MFQYITTSQLKTHTRIRRVTSATQIGKPDQSHVERTALFVGSLGLSGPKG